MQRTSTQDLIDQAARNVAEDRNNYEDENSDFAIYNEFKKLRKQENWRVWKSLQADIEKAVKICREINDASYRIELHNGKRFNYYPTTCKLQQLDGKTTNGIKPEQLIKHLSKQ